MTRHTLLRAFTRFTAIVVGACVALFALAWILSQVPVIQRELASQLSAMAGPKVDFGRIAPTLWPGLGISVDDINLNPRPEDPSQSVAKISTLVIVLQFTELLKGKVAIRSLSADDADITLERASDGSFPIEGLLDSVAFGGGEAEVKPTEKAASESSAESPMDALPELTITDSKIHFIDRSVDDKDLDLQLTSVGLHLGSLHVGSRAELQLDFEVAGGGKFSGKGYLKRGRANPKIEDAEFELEVVGTQLPARATLLYLLPGNVDATEKSSLAVHLQVSGDLGGSVKGDCTVQLPAQHQLTWLGLDWVGPISFKTHIGVSGGEVELTDSSLTAKAVQWGKVRGDDLLAHFQLASNVIRFKDTRFGFYAGTVDFSGLIDFRTETEINMDTKISQVDMHAFAEASSGVRPEVGFETLSGEFVVSGVLRPGDRRFDSLVGRGSLLMEGGELPSDSVVGTVGGAISRLIPSAARPKTDLLGSKTEINHLTMLMALQDGSVHVSNVDFLTNDYQMRGQGKVALTGGLDLHTEVDFTVEGMQKLFLSMAIPVPRSVNLLPSIPLFITGNLAHPIFIPELTALPRVLLRSIFRPIVGVGRAIGGLFSRGESDPAEPNEADPAPAQAPGAVDPSDSE